MQRQRNPTMKFLVWNPLTSLRLQISLKANQSHPPNSVIAYDFPTPTDVIVIKLEENKKYHPTQKKQTNKNKNKQKKTHIQVIPCMCMYMCMCTFSTDWKIQKLQKHCISQCFSPPSNIKHLPRSGLDLLKVWPCKSTFHTWFF